MRSNHATTALGHIGPEVRSIYSVDDKTCLPAGAEQEGPAHNPCSTHPPHPVLRTSRWLAASSAFLPEPRANELSLLHTSVDVLVVCVDNVSDPDNTGLCHGTSAAAAEDPWESSEAGRGKNNIAEKTRIVG